MAQLRVRALFIYPLKSAAGMRVSAATVDALGFAGDRRWMAIDDQGRFLSQRRLPRMALIQATQLPGDDVFLAAGSESIRVCRPADDGPAREVTVWQDTLHALDGGDEAARWLTAALEHSARLVYCAPSGARIVDRSYASGDERVGFADGFPLLLLGESSIHDLNTRLQADGKAPVGVERFRPNILIEGGTPFEEDGWSRLRFNTRGGAIEVDVVKPCARCSIISVDPTTGVQGAEPMRTLVGFRRRGDDVYVGQNALPRGRVTITTGDPVVALSQVRGA